jgi:hypothetical protein
MTSSSVMSIAFARTWLLPLAFALVDTLFMVSTHTRGSKRLPGV